MRELLAAFRRLDPSSRGFAIRAWIAAPVVELALDRRGLATTLDWIERYGSLGSSASTAPATTTTSARVGVVQGRRLVDAVYRHHFVRGACLPRALLQYALHRRDRVDAELRVGVRRAPVDGGPDVAAHAWVDPPSEAASAPFEPLLVRRSVFPT